MLPRILSLSKGRLMLEVPNTGRAWAAQQHPPRDGLTYRQCAWYSIAYNQRANNVDGEEYAPGTQRVEDSVSSTSRHAPKPHPSCRRETGDGGWGLGLE